MNSTFANMAVHQRMERRTEGVLEMNSVDAMARGIASGDGVEVFNSRGRIWLRAVVNVQVAAGVVSARLDWNKLGTRLVGRWAVECECADRAEAADGYWGWGYVLLSVERWI